MMTGGVAKNPGVVRAVEEKIGSELYICEEPEIVGAAGLRCMPWRNMESNAYESDADNRKKQGGRQVLEQVNHVILGKSEEIKEIMTVFLATAVLLEDIPCG